MAKREYVEANKRWLEEKAREEGVQALPRGIYYKVLKAGNPDGAKPGRRSDAVVGLAVNAAQACDALIQHRTAVSKLDVEPHLPGKRPQEAQDPVEHCISRCLGG